MRQRQRDYSQLQEQFTFLDKKYRQSQDERRALERDNDVKISNNLSTIDASIRELNYLRDQNRDAEVEQETILIRISEHSETITTRTEEYNELRQTLSVLESKIYGEKKEIERFDIDHRDATGISHKNYQEIQRLKELINVRELDLRGFQARINNLEADLDSNNRKISHLIEVKDVKEQENVTTQQRIAKEQLTISQLRTQVAQLEKDISYFEA